jgi:hypothetical protein
MTTRAQLEEILAARRARSRVRPPALHKRGRDIVGALAVIAILAASGAAMFFAVQLTTPKIDRMTTPSSSVSASIPFTVPTSISTATTFMATSVAMKVCTDIPDGRLHVRFAAGDGSEVRGYLAEGETVQLALATEEGLDSQMIQGELWQCILSPVAGWVNARYLCKVESR